MIVWWTSLWGLLNAPMKDEKSKAKFLWVWAHQSWTEERWENCPAGWWVQNEIIFGRRCVFPGGGERGAILSAHSSESRSHDAAESRCSRSSRAFGVSWNVPQCPDAGDVCSSHPACFCSHFRDVAAVATAVGHMMTPLCVRHVGSRSSNTSCLTFNNLDLWLLATKIWSAATPVIILIYPVSWITHEINKHTYKYKLFGGGWY